MRWLNLTIVAIAASCGAPNPEFCCVTEEQCAAAGVIDELRPCELGQACNPSNECVAKECETSLDCTTADRPTCENNLCVEGCALDDDCRGLEGAPRCDTGSGECVGCLSSEECPADREICDADTQRCRGCSRDDDCGDGVCIEATGRCVAQEQVIYVAEGGDNTSECLKASPCETLEVALGKVTGSRNVVKILSEKLAAINSTLAVRDPVTIDGTARTRLIFSGNPAVTISSQGCLFEDVSLMPIVNANVLDVPDGGALVFFSSKIEADSFLKIRGELSIVSSELPAHSTFDCVSGKLAIRESQIAPEITSDNCTLEINRSLVRRGNLGPPLLTSTRGLATIENNLIVDNEVSGNTLRMSDHVAGSVFRFNTLVHTTVVPGSSIGFDCSGVELSSNIIALNSSSSLRGTCPVRHTLFDLAAGITPSDENISADAATFFVDRTSGDYHLAPDSPARGLGEAGLVNLDLEGNTRPAAPDSGAFQAPE
jgi:hypothetical protein